MIRALAFLAAGSLAAQQIPIPPFQTTSTTPLTRGFWFQAPVDFVITALRVPDESAVGVMAIEVIEFAAPPPTFPATATGTQLFYANNRPSGAPLPVSIPVRAGRVIGILGGCGTATLASSFAAPGTFASSVLGTPMTLTRFGTQTNIHTTGGNQGCWSEPAGSIGRVEVQVAPAAGYAYSLPFGTACYDTSRSIYDTFPTTGFDLVGSPMRALFQGNHYVLIAGGTYVPPSVNAQTVPLADDAEAIVSLTRSFTFVGGSTTSLAICSNGFVSAATGNGTNFRPDPVLWLQSPHPRWGDVHDFDPAAAGSGQVKFEELAGVAYVTYDGVYDYGVTNPQGNVFQYQFDLGTGDVTYVYVSITGRGNGHLVGYAASGQSRDIGSADLSAGIGSGIATGSTDMTSALLAASARPRLSTTITLDTTRISSTAVAGLHLLGLTDYQNGLSLGPFGAIGCSVYHSTELALPFTPSGTSASLSLTLPTAGSGARFSAQTLLFEPGINPLGATTTNALLLILGRN